MAQFNGAIRFIIRDLENFRFSTEITVLPFFRKIEFFSSFIGEGLKVAGREDLEPEDPGIFDLISSELARGRHLASFCFTTSSSGLRSGRIPEKHTTNEKLGIPYNLRKLDRTKPKQSSRRFSGVVQTAGTPSVSSLLRGSYSQLRPLTKK